MRLPIPAGEVRLCSDGAFFVEQEPQKNIWDERYRVYRSSIPGNVIIYLDEQTLRWYEENYG